MYKNPATKLAIRSIEGLDNSPLFVLYSGAVRVATTANETKTDVHSKACAIAELLIKNLPGKQTAVAMIVGNLHDDLIRYASEFEAELCTPEWLEGYPSGASDLFILETAKLVIKGLNPIDIAMCIIENTEAAEISKDIITEELASPIERAIKNIREQLERQP